LWNCGGELGDPGPLVVEVELRLACGVREPAGDVRQPVARSLGFGGGELPVEERGPRVRGPWVRGPRALCVMS
jgi:hypothetical protein